MALLYQVHNTLKIRNTVEENEALFVIKVVADLDNCIIDTRWYYEVRVQAFKFSDFMVGILEH